MNDKDERRDDAKPRPVTTFMRNREMHTDISMRSNARPVLIVVLVLAVIALIIGFCATFDWQEL